MSVFKACGPAWTFDETTGQYYLHSFMPEQPDLNWDNPEVVAAMHDTIRFWMDRGVDGLRLDAIAKIAKDPLLRDHDGAPSRHDEDWESIHGCLRGIREVVDEYEDRMIVGEVALQDLHRVVGYLESGDQLHLAHNFVFIDQDWGAEAYGDSHRGLRAARRGNAPGPRGFSPTTTSRARAAASTTTASARERQRAILVMLYALRGTPFIYQGEELGLPDATIPPERVVDVDGRDPERAPIPWTPRRTGHGFTTGEPWLPFVDDGGRAQRRDPGSTTRTRRCNLTRALAACATETPALVTGTQTPSTPAAGVLACTRGDDLLVAVNFTAEELPLRRRRRARALQRSRPHGGERLARARPERGAHPAAYLADSDCRSRRRRSAASSRRPRPRSARPILALALGVEPGDDDGLALVGGLGDAALVLQQVVHLRATRPASRRP